MKLKRILLIFLITSSISLSGFAMNNGILFFTSPNEFSKNSTGSKEGISIWKSDGTENETVMVKDINPNDSRQDEIFTSLTNERGSSKETVLS